MKNEIQKQTEFWDSEYKNFDAIYSHKKSWLQVTLDQTFRKDMYQRFEFTMQNAEPIHGKTFLDVGCGSGRYAIEFAKSGAKKVIGLDIAENMTEASQEYAKLNDVNRSCTFFKTDLLNYRTDLKFDVSIGIGLFDYIKEPLPVIKKMKELTKDKIIMSFPRRYTWRAPIRKIRLSLKKCQVYFYTKNHIKRLMEDSLLIKYKIEKVGKLYCVVAICD